MRLQLLGRVKPIASKQLKAFVGFMEKVLVDKGLIPAESKKALVIAFISPRRMRELNRQFLKRDKLTDVLSFPSLSEENSFGELCLCGQKIKSQALAHSVTLEEEAFWLILHGFLHLLGYRHEESEQEAQKMYHLQEEIFALWRKNLDG